MGHVPLTGASVPGVMSHEGAHLSRVEGCVRWRWSAKMINECCWSLPSFSSRTAASLVRPAGAESLARGQEKVAVV